MTHLRYLQAEAALTPDERIESAAILIEDGLIRALAPANALPCPPDAERVNLPGVVAPGLIDLQINGAFGHDFTANPATLWQVAARLPRYGVTAFLPTIITSPPGVVAEAQAVVTRAPAEAHGAQPLGLHVEGPFLNPARRGAHNPEYLRKPDPALIAEWTIERGVRLVTLAPELPGALDIIQRLSERGIAVSAGHSIAAFDEAQAGVQAGLTYATHLFNAMPPLDHREPGLVGAALSETAITTGLIVDAIHVHPSMVAVAYRSKGAARFSLVTDAMAALGMSPGHYVLGDFEVTVDETSARLADGRLAGSVLSLDQAVRNLMAFTGCSLAEALATVTTTPARLLNLSDRGRLAPGCRADLVVLDADHQVTQTIIGGEVVYTAAESALNR